MARIERKVFYVGTWREDKVTDDIMRQIIARSLAEKGQRVKLKLSQDGLVLSKTVLFQENLLSSLVLQDVYFLTVNQRYPSCLLCIVADPVRKYLILAVRTANSVEAQEIISTFKALKDNPTLNSGNVVLRRKDNGNWTLRERSQLNANRHLQEIFKEESQTAPPTLSQPNGSAGGSYTPVIDGSKRASHSRRNYQLVPEGGFSDGVVVVSPPHNDVDSLSQELQDVKFVVEETGSVGRATMQSNIAHHHNNNNTEKSHYIEAEVLTTEDPEPSWNGGVIHVHSNGSDNGFQDDKPGEVRAVVDDHREDGVVRAHSHGTAQPYEPAIFVRNGKIQHPVTVPEPRPATATTAPAPSPAPNGYTDIPAYRIQRHVSTEMVQVPDFSRKVSQTGSLRSVSFNPEVLGRGSQDPRKFRSLRTSRTSGVPTTIVRPIEEVYRHARPPASLLKRQGGVYVAPVQVGQPASSVPVVYVPGTLGVVPPHRRRRSRPNSIHVMEGSELKVFHKTGERDDLLL